MTPHQGRLRAHVLGGGVAGIAAAFACLDRGFSVTLWESRAGLGGRVFSFEDRLLGDLTDNGPHVMMGCYVELRALLRRVGSLDLLEQPASLRLSYRGAGGVSFSMRLSRLPTPLALPLALLRLSGMTFGERLRAVGGMISSLRGAPPSWSIEDWLRARGQLGGPRRFLWDPLCFAIMNADPAEVSAALFLSTLRRAFGGGARRAAIWIARRPWAEILDRPARARLEHEGVVVRTGRRVRALVSEGGRVSRIEFGAGEACKLGPFDLVVSALPWHGLARVLPSGRVPTAFAGRSIVNVYFDCGELAALPNEGPLVSLLDGEPFQFLYRRPGSAAGRFALIAGDAGCFDGVSTGEIEARARAQLARYYPGAELPKTATVRITKEARATLLASVDAVAQRPRPGLVAGLSNLALCGDWTQTHLPSTLEGAAASVAMMMRALRV